MQNRYIKQSSKLIENTFFLYIVTFSNQLINLITVPYQTRVLGAVVYGKIGIALSVMSYVQIILDFGFILSATAQVADAMGNTKKLSKLLTVVTVIKMCLSVVILGTVLLIIVNIPEFKSDVCLYVLYYIAYLFNGLLPDYIYRGLECMKWIALRTLGIRLFFMLTMLIFIKTPEDYLFLPIFLIIGNMLAVLISFFDLYKKGIKMVRVYRWEYFDEFRETFPFFVSRFSASFYQALNGVILGILFSGAPIVGCYFAADKLVSLSKSCASPIADSIYPYMIKTKNYKLIKRILKIFMPCVLFGAVVLYCIAEKFAIIVFGKEFADASKFIQIMLPTMIVILPTYLLAFPVMVPLGLKKYANMSNVFGAIVQVCLLILLFVYNKVEVEALAVISCIAEIVVFLFRIIIIVLTVIKNKVRID